MIVYSALELSFPFVVIAYGGIVCVREEWLSCLKIRSGRQYSKRVRTTNGK